jgi:hypothetical protein
MRHILVSFGVLLSTLGCRGTPSLPLAPSTPPRSSGTIPSPAPIFNITGVVYDSTADGHRPLPGVAIDISVEYQSWPPTITTDSAGRYRAAGGGGRKLVAEKAGYSQPCRVPIIATDRDQHVYLVANDLLTTTGVPASMPIVEPVLRGRVFERTAQGEQPVVGAGVVLDFTAGMGWAPSATTVTDASGRYLLCNVVDVGFGFAALVEKHGYVNAFVNLNVKPPASFDIELKRQ